MTDLFDDEPLSPDELALMAYLDGEASEDQVARVENDPELTRQLAAMRRVAGELSAPVEPPGGAQEQAIAAALAAFDLGQRPEAGGAVLSQTLDVSSPKPTETAVVTPLRRPARPWQSGGWLAAAAVVLVLVGATVVLRLRDSTTSTDLSAAAEQSSLASNDTGAAAGGKATASAGAGSNDQSPALQDSAVSAGPIAPALGAFDDTASILRAARALKPPSDGSAASTTTALVARSPESLPTTTAPAGAPAPSASGSVPNGTVPSGAVPSSAVPPSALGGYNALAGPACAPDRVRATATLVGRAVVVVTLDNGDLSVRDAVTCEPLS